MYKTISIGYIITDEEEMIIDSYKNCDIIADEFVFIINPERCPKTLNLLTKLSIGDPKMNIFVTQLTNETDLIKLLLSKCTKEYILILKPYEILSDNCVLIRDVLESNTSEAYNIKTNYFIYDFVHCDNTGLSNLPLLRIVKNREQLVVVGDQIIGFVDPIIEINEVYINNYGCVKNSVNFVLNHLKGIDSIEHNKLKTMYLMGNYPLKTMDYNIHNQVIKNMLEKI